MKIFIEANWFGGGFAVFFRDVLIASMLRLVVLTKKLSLVNFDNIFLESCKGLLYFANTGCIKKMRHFVCLISLATNMLEG